MYGCWQFKYEQFVYEISKYDAEVGKVNKIPKIPLPAIYFLSYFNIITQYEMWNLVKNGRKWFWTDQTVRTRPKIDIETCSIGWELNWHHNQNKRSINVQFLKRTLDTKQISSIFSLSRSFRFDNSLFWFFIEPTLVLRHFFQTFTWNIKFFFLSYWLFRLLASFGVYCAL